MLRRRSLQIEMMEGHLREYTRAQALALLNRDFELERVLPVPFGWRGPLGTPSTSSCAPASWRERRSPLPLWLGAGPDGRLAPCAGVPGDAGFAGCPDPDADRCCRAHIHSSRLAPTGPDVRGCRPRICWDRLCTSARLSSVHRHERSLPSGGPCRSGEPESLAKYRRLARCAGSLVSHRAASWLGHGRAGRGLFEGALVLSRHVDGAAHLRLVLGGRIRGGRRRQRYFRLPRGAPARSSSLGHSCAVLSGQTCWSHRPSRCARFAGGGTPSVGSRWQSPASPC